MSLVGNLADLGLGDILQIISLSQKSGTLQLATASDSGGIGFVQGKVVMAVREHGETTVSELLIAQQLVTASQMQEMLKAQAQKPNASQSQPPLLWESNGVTIDKVEEAIKARIEALVYEMFEWEEGNFSFVVADDAKEVTRLHLASNRFVVMRGLNPQFLAMEGARLHDERERNDPFASFMAKSSSEAPPDEPERAKPAEAVTERPAPEPQLAAKAPPAEASPPIQKPAPAPKPLLETQPVVLEGLELVLIDDDPNMLRSLREKLVGSVPSLGVFNKVEAGLKRTRELLWANKRVVIVSDLILPRSDGAGILGGLEVLEKIRPDYPTVPVYLLTDYPNEEARERAEKLGVTGIISKPRRAELEKDKTRAVLDETVSALMAALHPLLAEVHSSAPKEEELIEKTERMEPIQRTRPIEELEREEEKDARGVATGAISRGLPEPIASVSPAIAPATKPEEFDISFDDALPELAAEAIDPQVASALRNGAANDIAAANADPAGLIDLSREIGLELTGDLGGEPESEQDRTMVVLKSLLFELMSPSSRDTIMLLVLRYASELFSRAALLLVARDELWGLGGFAQGVKNIDYIATTRKLRVRYDAGSVFDTVIKHKASERKVLNAKPSERLLAERLGITEERPVFVAPLISADRVAAILLGDNHQIGKDLGDTHGLEIFLLQAGMAMERALLERRLRELARRDTGGGGEG